MKVYHVQQKSPEWFALRSGKPTSSKFGSIVTSKGKASESRKKYAMQLAAELYAGEGLNQWGGNLDLERGNHLEVEAIRLYEFENDVQVERVGFISDDVERWGCSPDGLVNKDGMVQVKCLNAEHHVEAILRFLGDGTVDPTYIPQTQGEMWIAERQWNDLVFYHARLPMLVVRQFPIPAVVAELQQGLEQVLKERDRILAALIAVRDGPGLGDDEAEPGGSMSDWADGPSKNPAR